MICIVALFHMSACSLQLQYPEEGVWYCEGIDVEINFSMLNTDPKCVKRYAEDGSCEVCKCYIDHGNGIFILSQDEETMYIKGRFLLENEKFIITLEDETHYIFRRIGDNPAVPTEK